METAAAPQAARVVEVRLLNRSGATVGVALIDECDLPLITISKWSLMAVGYALGWRDGKNILMHRLIMNAQTGQEIDHANGNRLDNRRANLRFVTRSQNNANRRKPGPNRFKGICKARGLWLAQTKINGRPVFIGYFKTDVEAAKAYDAKAVELFGEFAHTNFPLESK
jgi:hypothetical protein